MKKERKNVVFDMLLKTNAGILSNSHIASH